MIAERTDVPIATLRNWQRGNVPVAARHLLAGGSLCTECGEPEHVRGAVPAGSLAYLLGAYLGDGWLAREARSWSLRVALDVAYPGVIDEVASAIQAVRDVAPHRRRPSGENYVVLTSYWRAWPCWLLPYERGRKHERKISLASWQRHLVSHHAGQFARGLIHTDGWRGENRVHVKGKDYTYPRYQFSSRSDDIRRLFTEACDALGVAWRPWGRFHISVARREAVALLDEHIGPKT